LNKVDTKGLGLKEQVLIAALEYSDGNVNKTFTAEELLVFAWEKNKQAWGLRSYEEKYPNSDLFYRQLDAQTNKRGIIDQGLFEKVQKRVYRLTPAGLAVAAALKPSDPISREKIDRLLETAVKQIIEHPVFKKWLTDPTGPKYFREAGHFWGIAPGTPAKTVRERVNSVEQTLKAALKVIEQRGVKEIIEQRGGRVLFDRKDIERCLEFQKTLKQRFARDLRMLDPEIEL
jgi:hypothetical protein